MAARHDRCIAGRALAVALVAGALPAAVVAAPTTHADVLGLCNGQIPCYTTIGAALAHAGPGAATVYVFPGTYAESLDLMTMGSALAGGGPAALSMISVDASGVPAPGATVNPAAPGGPGTGSAIFAQAYPAPVRLEGFDVVSPDVDGISLFLGTASLEVVRVTANNSANGYGVSLFTLAGDVSITESSARLNGENGLSAATFDGRATVTTSIAERNGGLGIVAGGSDVVVDGVHVEANDETGLALAPTIEGATLSVSHVEAVANGAEGVVAFPFTEGGWFGSAELLDVEAAQNVDTGVLALAGAILATTVHASDNGNQGVVLAAYDVVPGDPLTVEASDVVAAGSGDTGIVLFGREVVAHGLTATGNGSIGVGLAPSAADATLMADTVVATGNQSGITIFSPSPDLGTIAAATLRDSEASDNVEDGVLVTGDRVRLERVTTTGNGETGIYALALDTTLLGCRVANNREGVVATGDLVRIHDCRSAGNGPAGGGTFDGNGFVLVQVGQAAVSESFALANDLGWLLLDLDGAAASGLDSDAVRRALPEGASRYLDRAVAAIPTAPAHAFTFETTRTEASLGASMQIGLRQDATVRIGCSSFIGNGSAGLALFTDNLVDAASNYWGDPSGPTHPANPAGAGDAIHDAAAGFMGTVLYDPFLELEATGADCPRTSIQEIPALGPTGLALLALALGAAALALLRRRQALTG